MSTEAKKWDLKHVKFILGEKCELFFLSKSYGYKRHIQS